LEYLLAKRDTHRDYGDARSETYIVTAAPYVAGRGSIGAARHLRRSGRER